MKNKHKSAQAYWKQNLKLMFLLLALWFVVSFVLGIFLVDILNHIHIGGYKLGFWFAQQGSLYVFVGIVFYYARRMAQIDRKFEEDE